jgi:hypothetical protein
MNFWVCLNKWDFAGITDILLNEGLIKKKNLTKLNDYLEWLKLDLM